MINNKWRQITIIASALLLISVAVVIFFALQPKLTLYSDVDGLTTITVNDKQMDFKAGMTVPFGSAVTIKAQKDGYYPAEWTLDPNQQTSRKFTISLAINPTGTDTSVNAQIINNYQAPDTTIANNELQDILLQAAIATRASDILDFNSALNVNIIETKVFDYGSTIAYIIEFKPPIITDRAFLVVQKNNDVYTVTIGPGTNFNGVSTADLPSGLVTFMREKGYIE